MASQRRVPVEGVWVHPVVAVVGEVLDRGAILLGVFAGVNLTEGKVPFAMSFAI